MLSSSKVFESLKWRFALRAAKLLWKCNAMPLHKSAMANKNSTALTRLPNWWRVTVANWVQGTNACLPTSTLSRTLPVLHLFSPWKKNKARYLLNTIILKLLEKQWHSECTDWCGIAVVTKSGVCLSILLFRVCLERTKAEVNAEPTKNKIFFRKSYYCALLFIIMIISYPWKAMLGIVLKSIQQKSGEFWRKGRLSV